MTTYIEVVVIVVTFSVGFVLALAILSQIDAARLTWRKLPGTRRDENHEDQSKLERLRSRSAGPSWQSVVLGLFFVTALFAALTVLGAASNKSAGHITNTILFTDLSAVGALASGLAAVAVCVAGFLRRRKGDTQQANADVLNNVVAHVGHPLSPEEIGALAELARALNGRETLEVSGQGMIVQPPAEDSQNKDEGMDKSASFNLPIIKRTDEGSDIFINPSRRKKD